LKFEFLSSTHQEQHSLNALIQLNSTQLNSSLLKKIAFLQTVVLLCIGVRARGWGLQRLKAAAARLGQSHYFSDKSYFFRAEASSQKF